MPEGTNQVIAKTITSAVTISAIRMVAGRELRSHESLLDDSGAGALFGRSGGSDE
jgi:hypothetical protein